MTRNIGWAVVALVACAGGVGAQARTDQLTIPQVKVEADTIRILVSVVDEHGAPVKELGKANFKVLLDKDPVRDVAVRQIQESEHGISVVLAIDISLSMKGRRIEAAKQGAGRFLATLGDKDYCALMTFGNNVAWVVDEFTNDRRAIQSKLDRVAATDQNTVLNEAFFRAVQKATKAPTPQVAVVVLTDGIDDGSSISLDQAAREAAQRNIPVYTLGFGNQVDAKALAQIATLTGGRFIPAAADADLVDLYLSLLSQLASQYMLDIPAPTMTAGEHAITVEVQARGSHYVQQRGLMVAKGSHWWWYAAGGGAVLATGVLIWLWLTRRGGRTVEARKCIYCQTPLPEGETEYCAKCSGKVTEPASQPAPAATAIEEALVWLEVLAGKQQGQNVAIPDAGVTIGRGSDRTVVIEGIRSISRDHAEIVVKKGRHILRNTHGQGGTYINGNKMEMEEEPLRDNDRIGLGTAEARLIFHDRRAQSAAS